MLKTRIPFKVELVKKMTFEHFSTWVKTYPQYNDATDEEIQAEYELMTGVKIVNKPNKKTTK